jgi:aspartate aminotransferase-like enzyme
MPRSLIPDAPLLSETALAAMSLPMTSYDRSLSALLEGLRPELAQIFGSSQSILILPAGPELVQEAALREWGIKKSLHFITGSRSERWHSAAQSIGAQAAAVRIPLGAVVAPAGIPSLLERDADWQAVALAHAEESSGVLNPIREISLAIRARSEALVLCDATASASSTDLSFDRDRIDIMIAGAAAFGLPTSLSLLVLSHRAAEALLASPGASALRLKDRLQSGRHGVLPGDPHATSILALAAALREISQEGLAHRISRHWRLAARVRAFAREGFSMLAAEGYCAYSLTSLRVPEGFDTRALIERARAQGILLALGREPEVLIFGHSHDLSLEELEGILDVLAREAGALGLPSRPYVRDDDIVDRHVDKIDHEDQAESCHSDH